MAIQLGSAYGKVEIDSRGVTRGVGDANKSLGSMEAAAKKLGATLQSVGKAMTVAISVPLVLMAKDAVMMASSYAESLNKINVVFETSAKVIEDWSKDAAKNLGMSQQAALEAAGTYGNLFTAQGMGVDKAADMSMALVQLAADLASFNNAAPEEVLLALRSGLSGEIEPLKKFGIAMNEATMKAKAMELGLGDNIQALSEAEKIQVRYAIILDQTAKAQGDFARTSEGLANQLRTLKGNWGDTLKILGEKLVPIVEKMLVQLNKWLDWFNKADPKTQDFIAKLLLFAIVAGPLLIIFGKLLPLAFSGTTKSMNPFSGGIFGLIGTIMKFIGVAATIVRVLTFVGISTGAAGAFITGLGTAIAGVGAAIFSAIIAPLLLLIATIALVVLVWKNWDKLGVTITQLGFIIKMVFLNAVKNIMVTINQLWFFFTGAMKGIGMAIDWVGKKWDALVAKFKSFKLPAALTPGSPTPFEMGLRGIANAMDMVSNKNLPNLQAALAKPNNMSNSQSTSTTMHFSNGLTLRDVDALMDDKINRFARRAMGGV